MKNKDDKKKDVESLRKELEASKNLFVTGYEKLRVQQSLAYTSSDPVALAKALTAYAKANPTFTFKAGMVEGRVIDIKAIHDLASMPSKEEIFAKMLYLINAPAQRLATVINAVGRNLAVVIDQGCKENKFKS